MIALSQTRTSDSHPYNNIKLCRNDLLEARKAFCSATTTEVQYEQMRKTLALMYLYCPEIIRPLVWSTLEEATMREPYFRARWIQAVTV
jgi:hypothetical protein